MYLDPKKVIQNKLYLDINIIYLLIKVILKDLIEIYKILFDRTKSKINLPH